MTWWCTTHKRVARRIRKNQFGEDEHYCGESGIMLPCECKDIFVYNSEGDHGREGTPSLDGPAR
jgi:hypothetical protein